MPKKLQKRGKRILKNVEIQSISSDGIWILINDKEYFIPSADYPWFMKATIEQIYNLEFSFGKYLHWPSLDVDIELDALENPEAYPLKYS